VLKQTYLFADCLCVHRLIARHLARLQSVDVAAAAAVLGDNVRIDTEPSLFKSLYADIEHSAFNSPDPQQQARWFDYCFMMTVM